MSTMISVVSYVLLAGLALDLYVSYNKSTGTVWEKLLGAGKSSASVLQARVMMIGGLALTASVDLTDALNNPALKALVDQYSSIPAVGWTMTIAAALAEVARRRTLAAPVVGSKPAE